MATAIIDSNFFIEDDLVENLAAWFKDSIEDLKFNGDPPNIYTSSPHSDADLPAIFIYPQSVVEETKDEYLTDPNTIRLFIDAFVSLLTWRDLMSKLMRWSAQIRQVALGGTNINSQATGGSTTTLIDDSLIDKYPDDHFNGLRIKTLSGTGSGQKLIIADYEGSSGMFTFSSATAPDATTTYKVDGLGHWQLNDYLRSQRVVGTGYFPETPILGEDGEIVGHFSWSQIIFEGVKIIDKT
jgi:hypothetical protein